MSYYLTCHPKWMSLEGFRHLTPLGASLVGYGLVEFDFCLPLRKWSDYPNLDSQSRPKKFIFWHVSQSRRKGSDGRPNGKYWPYYFIRWIRKMHIYIYVPFQQLTYARATYIRGPLLEPLPHQPRPPTTRDNKAKHRTRRILEQCRSTTGNFLIYLFIFFFWKIRKKKKEMFLILS